MRKLALITLTTLLLVATAAEARTMLLARKDVDELTTLAAASVDGTNDYIPVYDASAGYVVKVPASGLALASGVTATAAEVNYNDITTLGTLAASKTWTSDSSLDTVMPTGGLLTVQSGGAITANSGSTVTLAGTNVISGASTISAATLFDDGTGASPDITIQDGTDETVVFSKVDAGFLTITTVAGDGVQVTTGNLKVGNGTPGTAQDGEDAYVEGVLEVDGATKFDGGVTTAGTLTTTGAISVDAVTLNNKSLSLPGRAKVTICGDATTVNNNTIYYGPSQDIGAQGRTCDITAAGNATEGTADEPAFENTAFQVLSMNCLNDQDANAAISFTLRSAAAATTPSITCSIADNARSCTTNAGTTTAIASGATIAIAAASTSDVGTAQWICELDVAY